MTGTGIDTCPAAAPWWETASASPVRRTAVRERRYRLRAPSRYPNAKSIDGSECRNVVHDTSTRSAPGHGGEACTMHIGLLGSRPAEESCATAVLDPTGARNALRTSPISTERPCGERATVGCVPIRWSRCRAVRNSSSNGRVGAVPERQPLRWRHALCGGELEL